MAGTSNSGVSRNNLTDVLLNGKFKNIITVSKADTGRANFVCSDEVYEGSDAACIQAAIDFAAANNIYTIYIFDGTYTIGTQITGSKSVNIFGVGNVTLVSNSLANDLIAFTGSVISTVTGSDVLAGATAITVSDPSGIVAGNLVLISDDTIWDDGSSYPLLETGEIHEILSVSGNIINFSDGLIHAYTTLKNVSCIAISPVKVNINNITFQGVSETTSNGLVSLNYAANCSISKCTFNKGGLRGLYLDNSYNISVYENKISNSMKDGTGYGISTSNACAHIDIYENEIDHCRHCIATGGTEHLGQARKIHVHNNNLCGGGSYQVIDAHGCVESLYVNDNIIDGNSTFALLSGAKITVFKNNIVNNGAGAGTRDTTKNMIYIVENNILNSCSYAFNQSTNTCSLKYLGFSGNKMLNSVAYLALVQTAEYISIGNNSIDQTTSYYGMKITSALGGVIENNKIRNSYRAGIYLISCSNLTLLSNVVQNSNTQNASGELYESGIALTNCTNIKLFRNEISDSLNHQRYSIKEYGLSDSNTIKNNHVSGATVKTIGILGAATIVKNNDGYTTENTGTATITAGQTTVVVNHGLAAAPTRVQLTPTTATAGKDPRVTAKEATTFTITIESAHSADISFDWSAVV